MTTPFNIEEKNINEKIDATDYFLTKMRENESDITFFRYNLEAFLCVAHTARDVIRKLNTKWFDQLSIATGDIGLYFWNLRNISVHQCSPNPKQIVWTTLTGRCSIIDENNPSPISDSPKNEVTGGYLYYFKPLDEDIKERMKKSLPKNKLGNPEEIFKKIDKILTNKDVITLCSEYIQAISTVWQDYKASK